MNPKTIHIIVKYFYPVAAGIETNVLETYSALAKKGWDITVHTSRNTLIKKNCLPPEETIRGLKIKRYRYLGVGYWPDIDWGKADIVCLHNFNLSHFIFLFFTLIRKILNKKNYALVVTPHGGFNPEWSTFPFITRLIKRFYHYQVAVPLVNLVVDKMRAVSEWEREEILKKHVKPEKVVIISNGVEDDAYADVDALASREIKEKVKSFGRYIIQIGRIYIIKNYETTIRALVHLPHDIKYVIAGPVGSEDYYQSLQHQVAELGLQNRVIFLGVIRGVDKYYLIKHATMMVHMAIWESFCNVVHEALSQGLVCIVADNTALPYLIKDRVNGFLIPTKNTELLAEKINYVLANFDSKEIKTMQQQNRILGLKDSWKDIAEQMNKLYLSLTT